MLELWKVTLSSHQSNFLIIDVSEDTFKLAPLLCRQRRYLCKDLRQTDCKYNFLTSKALEKFNLKLFIGV